MYKHIYIRIYIYIHCICDVIAGCADRTTRTTCGKVLQSCEAGDKMNDKRSRLKLFDQGMQQIIELYSIEDLGVPLFQETTICLHFKVLNGSENKIRSIQCLKFMKLIGANAPIQRRQRLVILKLAIHTYISIFLMLPYIYGYVY